jgi:hypothetical protein
MIYKYTSSKTVIAKVFADLNLQEAVHRTSDFQEWIGEGLEKIGAVTQYIVKTAGKEGEPLLVLDNYQAQLPFDFDKLIQVGYSSNSTGPFSPMRYATGSFDFNRTLTDSTVYDSTIGDTQLVQLVMSLYDLDYTSALTKINTEPALRQLLTSLVTSTSLTEELEGGTNFTNDLTFVITNNYIKTNISTGYILMSYLATAIDQEGYPMIPESESFKEALYWYINMKLMYPEWAYGRIRDAVYYHAEFKWNFYRKQAYAEGLLPDAEKLEMIKRTWLRLVPSLDEHSTFFSTMGQSERRYNTF